jgi:hypothetical protein
MWAERLGLWLMGLPAILAVRQDSTSRHIFRVFLSQILKPDPDRIQIWIQEGKNDPQIQKK